MHSPYKRQINYCLYNDVHAKTIYSPVDSQWVDENFCAQLSQDWWLPYKTISFKNGTFSSWLLFAIYQMLCTLALWTKFLSMLSLYHTLFLFLFQLLYHANVSLKATNWTLLLNHTIEYIHADSLAELNKINKNQEIFRNFRLKSCYWIRQRHLFFLQRWNRSITGGSTGSSIYNNIILERKIHWVINWWHLVSACSSFIVCFGPGKCSYI